MAEITLFKQNETGQQVATPDFEKLLNKVFNGQKEAETEAKPEVATMGQRGGLLGGIDDIEIFGVPVGLALTGGTIALVASELIEGSISATEDTMLRGFVKLAGAGLSVSVLSGFLGRPISNTVALFLTLDGFREILPLDEWLANLLNGITNGTTAQRRRGRGRQQRGRGRTYDVGAGRQFAPDGHGPMVSLTEDQMLERALNALN